MINIMVGLANLVTYEPQFSGLIKQVTALERLLCIFVHNTFGVYQGSW